MKKIVLDGIAYMVMKDVKNGFEEEEVQNKYTEYFHDFDYILGDWAYGKLRLKGFNSKTNPNFKPMNDIDQVEEYLKNYCAYECRYFILSKEKEENIEK